MRSVRLSIFAMVLTAASASPAASEWGAVALGPSGAFGWAASHGSRQAALDAALRACRGRCVEVLSFNGGCGAIATGDDGEGGWGTGRYRVLAENNALEACAERSRNCQVRVWACNADEDDEP